MEEMPFERYEDLIARVEVKAPWQDRQGNLHMQMLLYFQRKL